MRIFLLLLVGIPAATAFTVGKATSRPRQSQVFATREINSVRVASEELLELWNQQITKELEASQIYLAASIWADQNNFVGMASFFRAESDEERGHAPAPGAAKQVS